MSDQPSFVGHSTRFPIEFESEQEELEVLRRLWASALELGSVTQVPCDEDHDPDTGCCDGAGWTYLHTAPRILNALRELLATMSTVDERMVNDADPSSQAAAEAAYARALAHAGDVVAQLGPIVAHLGPVGHEGPV